MVTLQESLAVASKTEAIKPADLNRVIIDTTVQPKNVMFPTDARRQGGQVRADQAPALCPRQAVQA
jgi:hypothetical protein